MAIEALISLRRNGGTDLKPRGYVIAVKLAGAVWGDTETRYQQVVEWEDDELEQQLLAMRAAGEPHPVIALPYAEVEQDDIGEGQAVHRVVRYSREVVDVDMLQDAAETLKDHIPEIAAHYGVSQQQVANRLRQLRDRIIEREDNAGKLPLVLVRRLRKRLAAVRGE